MTQEAAIILHEIKSELHKISSPWRTRQGAALYAGCSLSEIDKAANAGTIKKYKRGGTPMFKTADLDKWIEGKGAQ